jgi:quercetin dioxygenase-like cupin family protein
LNKQNVNDFMEYSNDRFTKRVMFKEDRTAVFILNFKPGQLLPAHKHPGANLQLLVLAGSGTFTIDGKDIHVEKNDVIFINGEAEVAFVNDGDENVSLYATLHRYPDEIYAQNI